MQAEFVRFGLERFRVLTGLLQVLGAVGVLVGLKWPLALRLSSGGLAMLMLCRVIVRIRVNDRPVDMVPALVLMFANGYILLASQPAA